ncbi:MAG: DUF3789 domain-containing protein [Acutalibacteraceae bacterium]
MLLTVREFIFLTAGIFIGGIIGVVTMCLVQIGNCRRCSHNK